MKKYFITGLVILLPLAVTVALVVFIVNFLTGPFMGMMSSFLQRFDIINQGLLFLSPEQTLKYGSELLILFCLVAFTLSLGMIARWFFFKSLITLSDRLLHKIPLVNKVYKTTQEIIKTIFVSDKNAFKQVVMVPFPKPDTYALGLISSTSPQVCNDAVGHEMLSVLIPTTPNPTTGFLIMYKKEEIRYIDMKVEDAIKYIVSCGVITPESINP